MVTAYKSYLGGMEVFTQRLQRALEENGHTIEWFSLEDISHTPEWKWSQRLFFLPQREKMKAKAIARKFNPRAGEFDVVIANDYFGMFLNHPRVIMVTHGYYPDIHDSMPNGFSLFKKIWWNALGRIQKEAMIKSWKSVTVSHRNARVLKKYGCRVDVTIPHGIDTTFYSPISNARKKLSVKEIPNEPFLLFVGSHAPWKNPWLVEDLSARMPVAWLGKYTGTNSAIVPLPRIPDKDMPALYSAAAMLVHPAFHEGFGYAPIEAMACGTPVLFTNAGVGEEIAKVLPQLILNDPTSLIEAQEKLSAILQNKATLGKACRSYVEKHHSWNAWAEKWNNLILEAR